MTIPEKPHSLIALPTEPAGSPCDQPQARRFSNSHNAKFWDAVESNGYHVTSFRFVHQPHLDLCDVSNHCWDFTHPGGEDIQAFVLCKVPGKRKPQEMLYVFDYGVFDYGAFFVKRVKRSRTKKSSINTTSAK